VTPAVESMVAVTYVRDIGASRAFYGLLGFGEHSSGRADTSAWLALHRDGDIGGVPCGKRAEVKLADAAGDTVWACLAHADEILVTVPGSFIASQDEPGIGWFLSRRRG
jgi:hypothetical protein